MSLSKTLIFCLVLVQPRKTHPNMTEKLLAGIRAATFTKFGKRLHEFQ